MPAVDVLLRDHVTLQCECVDRMFLNGYVPVLQQPWQMAMFLQVHRRQKIASPALLGHMTQLFIAEVAEYSRRHSIPIMHFPKGARKEDVVKPYFDKMRAQGTEGMALIGIAQERVNAYKAAKVRSASAVQDGSQQSTVHSQQLHHATYCRL